MPSAPYTVIIQTFNNECTIKRCLNSIRNQSVSPQEIIIFDDGSVDATIKIIQQQTNLPITLKEYPNSGPHVTKALLRQSNSLYTAILDGDDFWHEDKIKRQLDFIIDNEFVGLLATGCNVIGDDMLSKIYQVPKLSTQFNKTIDNNNELRNELLIGDHNPICRSSLIYKTDLIHKFVELDTRLSLVQDVDIYLQLLRNNVCFKKISGGFTNYVVSKSNLSFPNRRKKIRYLSEKFLIIKKHLRAEFENGKGDFLFQEITEFINSFRLKGIKVVRRLTRNKAFYYLYLAQEFEIPILQDLEATWALYDRLTEALMGRTQLVVTQ